MRRFQTLLGPIELAVLVRESVAASTIPRWGFGLVLALKWRLMRQLLISEPMGFIGGDAKAGAALFFVGLEVAFAPVNVAVSFER